MSKRITSDMVSLRVRFSQESIDRIDRLVGEAGRQKYIRESVLARLDGDIPPAVNELIFQVEDLKARVSYLERLRDTSAYRGNLSETVKMKVCRDELDRNLVVYIIKNRGATTPELAETLLGDSGKRRTILDRIAKLNERAKNELGRPILAFEKGEHDGKRGAWWATDLDSLMA
jgi:hypothetical protein